MQVSPQTLELARRYLSIVDVGEPEQQGAERQQMHEALLDAFERERIPFHSRFEARWIARWLLARDRTPTAELPDTVLMFAKQNTHNGAPEELFFTPPDDNRAGLMPVMVVVMPFTMQPFVTDRSV
jgi:hypothetical protein